MQGILSSSANALCLSMEMRWNLSLLLSPPVGTLQHPPESFDTSILKPTDFLWVSERKVFCGFGLLRAVAAAEAEAEADGADRRNVGVADANEHD